MRPALRFATLVSLCISLAWWVKSPGFEPALATIGFFAALAFQEVRATSAPKLPYDMTYTTANASQFYDAIARGYDARNSTFLLRTHREVITQISAGVSGRDEWAVLDLGGGTGRLIADHFYDRPEGTWVYVDSSAEMAKEFQKNMKKVRLRTEVVLDEIDSFLDDAAGRQKGVDVILISLTLSSLASDPDWNRVSQLLAAKGRLIIADIEPSYNAIHPYYSVLAGGKTHALRARPVHLAELANRLQAIGLRQVEAICVKEESMPYSFVAVFERAIS